MEVRISARPRKQGRKLYGGSLQLAHLRVCALERGAVRSPSHVFCWDCGRIVFEIFVPFAIPHSEMLKMALKMNVSPCIVP